MTKNELIEKLQEYSNKLSDIADVIDTETKRLKDLEDDIDDLVTKIQEEPIEDDNESN